ncbi:hypothetical protein [Ruegeria sp.]|uniref:hypothetical protein n=1 Tax=Ruegeria sp. TaxID=1879320 RepID=UPI003C7D8A0D
MCFSEMLKLAFETALRRYDEYMVFPPEKRPCDVWIEAHEFWAVVEAKGDGYLLSVTTGLVEKVIQLWAETLPLEDLPIVSKKPLAPEAIQMTQISLVWLMLHEFHHIDMHHFDLTGEFAISETRNAPTFGVSRRASLTPNPLDAIPPNLRELVPFCLELQADHDAAEMLLENYSDEEWNSLRLRAMAASAMMMLIEREDEKHGPLNKTHPKASTRIFQLLGHLAEMPLIAAQTHQDSSLIPDAEELEAFSREVTIPCFFDAIRMAQITGATSIASDLGDPANFFKDLEIAKLGDPSQYDELETQGAQEWAKLWPCNEALKPLLGGHFTN